jgi:hypothetical protein
MQTMTIEYDGRNKAVKRTLENLISSGQIRRKMVPAREKRIAEFTEAVRQCKAMAADIAINGADGYQTMDEFLETLE